MAVDVRGPGGSGDGPAPGAGGGQERSMDRGDRETDRDHLKKDNEHSNKGGKVRGLKRADQVAGEHGDKGRDKAEQKQDK